MTAPLVTPRNPANTGAATVTTFPFAKARMRYKEDRRPTIPEPLKDEFLLDLLAPAEARFQANPGGVTYANLAMPDADVLTALEAWFYDLLSSTKLRSQPGHFSSAPSSSGPVGLQPDHIYRSQLSPWRFKIRSALLVTLNKEMTILESIQRSYLSGPLDRLMVHSLWLGSHQFFILALPLIFWLGNHHFKRSPVYILGMSVYFTGILKDLFCIPCPYLLPIQRLAISNCASKYGFPFSHSAISASTFLMGLQYALHVQLIVQKLTLFLGLILYGFLLVFGRVYCRMHLIQDVACGWTIGVFAWTIHQVFGEVVERWATSTQASVPLVLIVCGLILTAAHPQPVDDCPCFEDSTAFVAVSVAKYYN
ncbi:hypothetical protein PtB15_14B436 [Puccinia triticina]|nr:hypothetical protein PtB15_14B436 [Puccinia triticina]